MAQKEQFTVGELLLVGVSNGAVTVLERDSDGNVSWCKSSGAPPASAEGYAIGCLYIRGSNGALYSNKGTATSCSFLAY